MRRTLAASLLVSIFVALLGGCSKKSSAPPTAPPPDPACSLSATALSFDTVTVGSSADRSFTLRNAGSGTLSGTVTESCPEFSVVGSSAYALSAGEVQTFTIRFSPGSEGAKRCTLSTGSACAAVSCTGTGRPSGTCEVAPSELDFGTVTVGQSADRTFSITNSGSGTLAGSVSESCPEFAVIGNPSYSLAPGASATFTVRFAPAQAGSEICTLSTGTASCAPVRASGSAVAGNPSCQVSVSELVFPRVGIGERSDATFSITNTGTATLTGTVAENCPAFSLAGQASYTLAPGESQTIIVRFAPLSEGEQTCTLDVGPGCSTVLCRGTGVVGCSFEPPSLDFGYVRRGETRCGSLTLTNHTSSTQQGRLFAETSGSGGYAGSISLDGVIVSGTTQLPYALGPSQSRTLSVCWDTQFASAPCDSIQGSWRIRSTASSSAGCLPAEARATGIITRGCACSVTPTTLSFGSVVVGDASPEEEFRITNESGIDGLRGTVRVVSGEFEASPSEYLCSSPQCVSCGFLEPLVKVQVRFRPTRLGSQVGKIVVENLVGCLGPGATTLCDTVTVTGTGILASPPECGVSTNLIDMGEVYFGSFKDTTFTIRNVGGGTLADSIRFLDNAPPFQALTRFYSLGPGDSVSARIRFVSSGTPGHTYSYVANISTGSQCMSQGLGIEVRAVAKEQPQPPRCALSTQVLEFGSVRVGESAERTFELRNSGDGLLCGSMSESCPDFVVTQGASYCFRPPAFVQVRVRFTPRSAGFQECTLQPGANCPAMTLRGTGF